MSNTRNNRDERFLDPTTIQTAASVVPAVLPPIVRHFAYPFKVGENKQALASAVEILESMENDVYRKKAMRNPDFPASTVDVWLNQVNKVKNEAKHIIEEYQHRIRFIHKLGPDYMISRKADKKLKEVKELCNNQIIINLISNIQALNPPPSPGARFNLLEINVQRRN